MNLKTELIALAVRLVADKTSLIHKPDTFEVVLTDIFGGESYDVRIAKDIEKEAARVVKAVARIVVDRKFKKIVANV